MPRRVGVLALQGDYAAHARVLAQLGCDVREVRLPADLSGITALCLPGGESTTMSLLLDRTGLREPLRALLHSGLPTLATCAGAILLARRLERDDGSIRVQPLELLDATVERNAYGRQVDSFEAKLRVDWTALGQPAMSDPAFHGVFIRAPQIRDCGPAVAAAAWHGSEIAAVRQGNLLAAAFHPELADDPRLHQAVLAWR